MNQPQNTPPANDALNFRTIAMPADTNYNGDVFGGWLLAQMDIAGGNYAFQHAKGRVATVGIEAMSFHLPVYVGDEVSCYCHTLRTGNTSITVHIETWVRRLKDNQVVKVTEGNFIFVALDDKGKKRQIPSQLAE
ncbi:acyl-CoA thioesterase [Beggiatoa leptomitoformis]|uniref:Acyl-CoA thioesterase n=1 Tax=Beggiatoa leptomitoformis TaxID=288004 RepID=A0A2N9YCI7_9GAMM|nr:acyl-CoA thioesterase [Beggiatoa leptomitoformis]ALG66526.1 acyl-CoA thioesterase [Beggiatoa leptomitoformis]AUI68177.1 acyl-CoA thioesterase [Beggiatoa leptomitoformis]